MFFSGTSRFRPIRLLGTGGMGSVHLVHDEQLGTEVALKTLKLSSGMDLYRFKREFRALADVKHPNLVTLYELISEGPLWFFTMEYVAGAPFDRFVLAPQAAPNAQFDDALATVRNGAQATSDRILQTVRQLCVGVHAMHEAGCVHRDLKPSNVLVTEQGRVVILDFGLARQTGSGSISSGSLSGTPAYMAPEQATERTCMPAADWYAVGIMIYEVLTGRCPFEGALFDVLLRKQTEDPPPPVQINPQADELLSELCARMIHRDPLQRPLGDEILVRLGASHDTSTSPRLHRHTPAVMPAEDVLGRDLELSALCRAYSKMRKGDLAVVVVEGSSGMGKTRLVESFLDNLLDGGAGASAPLVLRGRCHERETLAFKALDHVVDGLSYRLASLSADDQAYILPDGILYLSEIFPVLRQLKLAEHRRYFLPALRDAMELRNQAFVAFCDLLKRMARTQPLVIFIDDLQWADRDSFSLLRALSQQPGAPAMLLIASLRKSADDAVMDPLLREFVEQPGVENIKLVPLSPENTRALVGNLLVEAEIGAAVSRRIADAAVQEAGGNPFFVVELVHHLCTLTSSGQGVGSTLDGNAFRLDNMILDRVGSLPAESQRLLRVIALAGDPLPQRTLATAAGLVLGSEEWERGISALVEESLVQRRGRRGADLVEPYHDRIREAVVDSLDEAMSRQLSLQLAQAVEQWDCDRTDLLARYWLSAKNHERAKRYAFEAAAEARTKLAFDRAAQLYQTAAEIETDGATRADLLRAVGECQASNGCAVLAAEAYQGAAALSDPAHAAHLRHLAAEQLLRGGEIARGLDVLGGVLKEAGLRLAPSPRRAALSVGWRVMRLRLRGISFIERPAGRLSDKEKHLLDVLWAANIGLSAVDTLRADDFLLRFIMLALKSGDIRRVAQGLSALAGQLAALGGKRFGWATHLASEAEVLARRSSDPAAIGMARLCKSLVRYFAGEFDAAANDLMAVEQYFLSRCRGVSWELATARSFTCFALRLAGRVRELCERFDRYTADADRAGDRFLETNLRTYQTVVWLVRDDVARARREIEGVLDAWPKNMYHIQHFFYLYARCEQALYSEKPEVAWQAIRDERRQLQRSALFHVSGVRIEHAWISGRVALALAEKVGADERKPLLQAARTDARHLRKAEHRTGVAMGAAIEAGVRWLSPGAARTDGLFALDRAVATAEAAGAILLAESGRRWLGDLTGGRRGEELRARSNGWMANQGVRNPARIAHLFVPGFRGREQE
jgi:eukaryotic-like serine/threonine-protein kinase